MTTGGYAPFASIGIAVERAIARWFDTL